MAVVQMCIRDRYDVALIGHYTKDTIVSSSGTRLVNGGAFNYGAHVAARMGLKVAAVTRLAKEDRAVVDELEELGVDLYATYTPQSTCLRLVYPLSLIHIYLSLQTAWSIPQGILWKYPSPLHRGRTQSQWRLLQGLPE